MSINSNRIKSLENEIQKYKYTKENNMITLKRVQTNLREFVNNLNEDSTAYVTNYFPQLLNVDFIDNITDLSYESLMEVQNKIISLQNAILDDVENGLK